MSTTSGSDVFVELAKAIPIAATSPLGLIALLGVTGAATFLHWSQARLKAETNELVAVPEKDRRRIIEGRHGPIPKEISSQAWLKALRQKYLLLAYISTLAALLLGFIVLYGRYGRPSLAHAAELRKAYAVLHEKLASHELAARNLRQVFADAGARAVDPDPETEAHLTVAITAYNEVYDDLRRNRYQYENSVTQWLTDVPELARETSAVVNFGLDDVHQVGVKGFNTLFKSAGDVRELRSKQTPEAKARIEQLKREAGDSVPEMSRHLESSLGVYSKKIEALTQRMGES